MYANLSAGAILYLLFCLHTACRVAEANPQHLRASSVDVKTEYRDLALEYNYTDPVWFASYKAKAASFLRRCQFLENVAPVNGTVCTKSSIGSYACAFGSQTCPVDGSRHPNTKCLCDEGTQVWSCVTYMPCRVTSPVKVCPTKHPLTFNPPLTCTAGLSCPIASKTCCGKTIPRYICSCTNSTFDCDDGKSCADVCPSVSPTPMPTAIRTKSPTTRPATARPTTSPTTRLPTSSATSSDDTCPNPGSIIPPTTGSACNLQINPVTCRYDKTCCCNSCIARFQCDCEQGKWNCRKFSLPDCPLGPCPNISPTAPPQDIVDVLPTKSPVTRSTTAAPTKSPTTRAPTAKPTTSLATRLPTARPTMSPTTRPPTAPPTVRPTSSPTTLASSAENTCPNPGSIIPPTIGSACSILVNPVTCKYDQTCCCNSCIPLYRCDCVQNKWSCTQIALDCLPGPCPGATPSSPPQDIVDVLVTPPPQFMVDVLFETDDMFS